MASCSDARAPNLHLLLAGILPHTPGVLALLSETSLDEPVLWLDLLHRILAVVDEAKTCRVTTSELCVEAKDDNHVLVGLALGCDEIFDLVARGSSSSGVLKIDNKLLPVEQFVDDVLAYAHRDLGHRKGQPKTADITSHVLRNIHHASPNK